MIRVRRSYNVHGGVGSPKSGKVRSVPLVPDVAQCLARLAGREHFTAPADRVFGNDVGAFPDASSLRIRYRAAQDRAGLQAPSSAAHAATTISAPPRSAPPRRPTTAASRSAMRLVTGRRSERQAGLQRRQRPGRADLACSISLRSFPPLMIRLALSVCPLAWVLAKAHRRHHRYRRLVNRPSPTNPISRGTGAGPERFDLLPKDSGTWNTHAYRSARAGL